MTEWRRTKRVLVTEAHTIGSLAVIRSLGRAGYHVMACSSRKDALGFLSNFARESVCSPDYADEAFVPWFDELIEAASIDAIVPSEGLLLALMPRLQLYGHLLPCSSGVELVRLCLSKCDLFDSFGGTGAPDELRKNLPKYRLIDCAGRTPSGAELLAALGSPLYFKADAVYSRRSGASGVHRELSPEGVQNRVERLSSEFRRFLVQAHVHGVGVGVFFLVWEDEVRARFMHLRLHEVPHTGGVSSYRRSWWQQAIYDDALRRVRHTRWNGVSMFEYRWDSRSQRFCLMEMNSRFWGSLHLALYSGVDFPRLLLDAFFRRPDEPVLDFPRDVRSRLTVPGEVEYVWSRLKDKTLPLLSRLWSVMEFWVLSANPGVKSDLLFPGDRGLFWARLQKFLQDHLKSIAEPSR